MPRNRRFNLKHSGKNIRSIDDLRLHVDFSQLLLDYQDGRLQRWLRAMKSFKEEIMEIHELNEKTELKVVQRLIQILGLQSNDLKRNPDDWVISASSLKSIAREPIRIPYSSATICSKIEKIMNADNAILPATILCGPSGAGKTIFLNYILRQLNRAC
jgi:polynucleotide 5'-kinase involved in rRNA processing